VWIWRNGHLEPHKLDRVIAAGQLDLGDASERSSSDSEVALCSHEHLDTPGWTRDTEGSRPDISRSGSPTGSYPDEKRFLTAFSHKLVVVCGGSDGGMILL